MSRVSTEWMVLENGDRMLCVCRDGLPILLANEWLMQVARNASSPKTAKTYAERLTIFFGWLELAGVALEDFSKRHLSEFRAALELDSDQDGYLFQKDSVGTETRYQTLACAVRFLEWATQVDDDTPLLRPNAKKAQRVNHGMLRGIVSGELKLLKPTLLRRKKKRLPKFLTDQDVDVIRHWIDRTWADNEELRVRNRAIFELLYDTGLRLGELCSLRWDGLDPDERTLLVPYLEEEYNKARKTGRTAALQKTGERVVVFGERASQYLEEYVNMMRPREAMKHGHGRLFCTHHPKPHRGKPMTPHAMNHIFSLMNRPPSEGGCGLTQTIHAHLWRHTSATSLRNKGLDTRVIQEQLGHKSPSTTQIYDHVAPRLRREKIDEARAKDQAQQYEDWGLDD